MKRIPATARQIRASPQPGMGCDREGVVGTEVSVVVIVDDDDFVVSSVKITSVVEFFVGVTVVEDVEEVVNFGIVNNTSVSTDTLLISVDVLSSSFLSLTKFCFVSNLLSLSIGVARSVPVQNITMKTHLQDTAIVT